MLRLVIVDADPGLRHAARVIGEETGWDVTEASTAADALAVAGRPPADLVVWLGEPDEDAVVELRQAGAEVVGPIVLPELIDLLRAGRWS